jgi:exosortase D (VPLPA-CTERM-specific)
MRVAETERAPPVTSIESGAFARSGRPLSAAQGPLWLALAAMAAVVVFWRGFVSLVDAWSIPEYSHGPIIPLVSAFLFLREMRMAPPVDHPITDRWPGVLVALAALAVGVLGNLVRIPDIVTYGFIIWVAGVVLVCFGLRRGATFWPAVLHLVFMLPLPQFIYWQVSIYLQTVSSEIGVGLITLFGIPVFLDGNIIDLGVYKLQVAEACSGLRYLFPMLSFSYVFAVLYQGPAWHKAVLLLSAAPITVAMNSFRIGMIGVLVNSYGIEHAEGFLHTFEGWIIFVACVLILFLEAALLQRLTRNPKPLSETLDIEFEGLGTQLRRFTAVAPSAALGAVLALTAATAMTWLFAPERASVTVARDPLVVFPTELAGWSGRTQSLEPSIERVLGADDYFSASYVHPDAAAPVDFFVAYYRKQTEGGGIHSPEVCIPAGGWEVSSWEPATVTAPDGSRFEVNRAIIQKGVTRRLVYFWFEQRGRRYTSDYTVKAMTVWDSLMMGRTDGGLVRLITPIDPREGEEAADARLQDFVAPALAELARFVPD